MLFRSGPDNREIIIIDNRYRGPVQSYYVDLPPPVIRIPRERYILETERASGRDIYAVLTAPPVEQIDRRYTLDEIRYSPRVRERMPRVDIDTINFESGSWAITPDQVEILKYDNIVSAAAKADGHTLEGLGITPESIGAVVPSYLWRFRKTGQFRGRIA